jgi:hypothetical protein
VLRIDAPAVRGPDLDQTARPRGLSNNAARQRRYPNDHCYGFLMHEGEQRVRAGRDKVRNAALRKLTAEIFVVVAVIGRGQDRRHDGTPNASFPFWWFGVGVPIL